MHTVHNIIYIYTLVYSRVVVCILTSRSMHSTSVICIIIILLYVVVLL